MRENKYFCYFSSSIPSFTFYDGYLEMTNNTAERAVKPFVVQRKVFQTSGSYAGARYTGKIFSIIQTCLINNVNVEKNLNYLLNNLNRKPIEELLPYSKEIRKMK
ncbi:MAG: transposase [Bacillales bacterium]|nr:transposase [Bacillales bacterium]